MLIATKKKLIRNISTLPTDGLIAYYPFNGNANDESGNGYHGIVNGATLASDRKGNMNSAYYFDGVNDYIQIPFILLNGESEFSICGWVNTDASSVTNNTIFGSRGSTNNHLIDLRIFSPNTSFRFDVGNGSSVYTVTLNNNTLGAWIFLALTFTGSTQMKIENLSDAISSSGIPSAISSPNINDFFYFGMLDFLAGFYFRGYIDDFRIYNRVLTTEEITALYNE